MNYETCPHRRHPRPMMADTGVFHRIISQESTYPRQPAVRGSLCQTRSYYTGAAEERRGGWVRVGFADAKAQAGLILDTLVEPSERTRENIWRPDAETRLFHWQNLIAFPLAPEALHHSAVFRSVALPVTLYGMRWQRVPLACSPRQKAAMLK